MPTTTICPRIIPYRAVEIHPQPKQYSKSQTQRLDQYFLLDPGQPNADWGN